MCSIEHPQIGGRCYSTESNRQPTDGLGIVGSIRVLAFQDSLVPASGVKRLEDCSRHPLADGIVTSGFGEGVPSYMSSDVERWDEWVSAYFLVDTSGEPWTACPMYREETIDTTC